MTETMILGFQVLRILRENGTRMSSLEIAPLLGKNQASTLKVLQALAKGHIIKSHIGRVGGYSLPKDSFKKNVLDVCEALGGKSTPIHDESDSCAHIAGAISARVRASLVSCTLEDFFDKVLPAYSRMAVSAVPSSERISETVQV